jgi:DNA mismatch endonuclease, patch repair protein
MTRRERSVRMSRIRSRDTTPELIVRSVVHKLGYRFRLHQKSLPGQPDLVFKSKRKIIFVHGCFWHQHEDPNCKTTRKPKSNRGYWTAKLRRNVSRDREHATALSQQGWELLVLWECQLKDESQLGRTIREFLG